MELCLLHPQLLGFFALFLPALLIFRSFFLKRIVYRYPLAGFIANFCKKKTNFKRPIMIALRMAILVCCAVLVCRPRWVDKITNVKVDGIDIVLSIDVSGSMQFFDDLKDPRSRLSVAKKEAINFIKNRLDDQIGVTIFGVIALTIAPLTFDKSVLEQVVDRLEIGEVDPQGTNLFEALALSIARLKDSKAKSKIVILLTDGNHNVQSKMSLERCVELAKELGVRVYTVGIGSPNGGYASVFPGSYQRVSEEGADMALLDKIATSTGGKAFSAHNPKELEQVYSQIDKLEKTERKSNQYFSYQDVFWPIVGALLGLIFLESLLCAFLWRGA